MMPQERRRFALFNIPRHLFSEATAILNAYPDVKLIMAICSPAVPGGSLW